MITKNRTLKFLVVISVFIYFEMLVPSVYAALPLTQRDVDSINKKEFIRDPEEPVPAASCGSAQVGSVSSLYMIGDSITEGSTTNLLSAFTEQGTNAKIDGLSSRSLTEGDDPKDGLTVLKDSASDYAEVEVVVIALGTNGGLDDSGVTEAFNTVKEVNSGAVVFWVNIGVDNSLRTGSELPAASWNKVLTDASEKLGFFIIDWESIVKANGTDFNIIVESDGLGVHPNTEGKKLFTQQITNDVYGKGTGNGCDTVLTGADNPEKVWNYMIAKGLTATQAAGFMGNMQEEAGFEPRRVEYPVKKYNDVWLDGRFPDSLSDTVTDCLGESCRPGNGIVQWTAPSRKDNLRAYAAETGKSEGDLGLQLDFVWQEISESPYSYPCNRYCNGATSILAALEQTTTIEESTNLILRSYEIPASIDAAYAKRIGFANSWLVRFGSGGN